MELLYYPFYSLQGKEQENLKISKAPLLDLMILYQVILSNAPPFTASSSSFSVTFVFVLFLNDHPSFYAFLSRQFKHSIMIQMKYTDFFYKNHIIFFEARCS